MFDSRRKRWYNTIRSCFSCKWCFYLLYSLSTATQAPLSSYRRFSSSFQIYLIKEYFPFSYSYPSPESLYNSYSQSTPEYTSKLISYFTIIFLSMDYNYIIINLHNPRKILPTLTIFSGDITVYNIKYLSYLYFFNSAPFSIRLQFSLFIVSAYFNIISLPAL